MHNGQKRSRVLGEITKSHNKPIYLKHFFEPHPFFLAI